LRYLLKIPTPPSSAQSFGISIHAVLNEFYSAAKKGKRVNQKFLLRILDEEWIDEGYSSKTHERRAFKKAKRLLGAFYQKEYDSKNLPVSLEQTFRIPIKDTKPLMIGGKIDVVKKIDNSTIEIIDYKTGDRVPSQKDVDKDLQLTIYALAANSIKSAPFNKKPENVKLTLHFLETGERVTTTRSEDDLIKAQEEVLKIRNEIEKSEFNCSGHLFCQKCEFKMMCQVDD